MCSCRAALEKDRFSATATKYRRWNISIDLQVAPPIVRSNAAGLGGGSSR